MSIELKEVKFVGSYTKLEQCPQSMIPEYAFAGRSNVGKSSLINALTGKKQLARVSKQPGKTQTLNYFMIDDQWHLVDLPGYGYAKVSKKQREDWNRMINYYLKHRQQLINLFILIDSRIPPQKSDLEFINKMGKLKVPFSIVFTKVDKVKPKDIKKVIKNYQNALQEHWHDFPTHFLSSSTKNQGMDEILNFIYQLNNQL